VKKDKKTHQEARQKSGDKKNIDALKRYKYRTG
jgi:hypothetical protein